MFYNARSILPSLSARPAGRPPDDGMLPPVEADRRAAGGSAVRESHRRSCARLGGPRARRGRRRTAHRIRRHPAEHLRAPERCRDGSGDPGSPGVFPPCRRDACAWWWPAKDSPMGRSPPPTRWRARSRRACRRWRMRWRAGSTAGVRPPDTRSVEALRALVEAKASADPAGALPGLCPRRLRRSGFRPGLRGLGASAPGPRRSRRSSDRPREGTRQGRPHRGVAAGRTRRHWGGGRTGPCGEDAGADGARTPDAR